MKSQFVRGDSSFGAGNELGKPHPQDEFLIGEADACGGFAIEFEPPGPKLLSLLGSNRLFAGGVFVRRLVILDSFFGRSGGQFAEPLGDIPGKPGFLCCRILSQRCPAQQRGQEIVDRRLVYLYGHVVFR